MFQGAPSRSSSIHFQDPPEAFRGPGLRFEEVVAGTTLIDGLYPLFPIERGDRLGVFPDAPEEWVFGLALLVPKREIEDVGLFPRGMGENEFFEVWIP